MATLEQLQGALVKADAAGDVEAARAFAGEIRKMMSVSKKADIDGDAISQGARNFADEMGAGKKFLAGIGSGMNSVKQALTFAPKSEVDETKKLDAPLLNTGMGTAGNIVGNIAATAPAAFIPGANTVLGAGAIGAGVGALTTPGDAQDRTTGATYGGLGGMAGQLIPRAFSAAKAAAEPLTEKGRAAIIGRVMNRAAGDNAGAVTQRLQNAAPLVPGSMPTAAEVAESGGIAALQRAMSAADPEAYTHRIGTQNAARLAQLDSIAPRAGSVPEAAANFGNLYDAVVPRMEKAAGKRVSGAFDSIDPFNEVKIQLPIDAMRAAQAKYLGRGTFGDGGKAAAALREAESIGLENVKFGAPKTQGQSLAQAVRKAGGIKADGSGDLASLTNKGSGSSGLVTRSGVAADELADEMARRGFIKNADPDELVQALEGGFRGREAFGHDTPDSVYAALRAATSGGPTGAQIPKNLDFQTIQNFRSSLGEAAQKARLAGDKKEAAALSQMSAEIENKIASVADGKGNIGEFFAPDQIQNWREALRLHSEKMQRFHTGPQKSGFRTGGDGQPVTQGGEWAGKFFNSTGAQRNDMQSFKRVAGEQEPLVNALKSYAMTDAVGNKAALTDSAFRNWRGNKSEALSELLSGTELGKLDGVAADLARRASADNLGRGVGSNTFQNFAMDNLAQQGGVPSAVRSTLGAIPGLTPGMTLLSKGAGAVGNMAYKKSDEAMRQAMAQALLDPKASAALMEAASKPKALARMLERLPQDKLPAADVLRLLQAAPGIAGAAALPAYLKE